MPPARAHILSWLAEGTREVRWALCSLPRERWAEQPPEPLGTWPALRHARHLALRERLLTLPLVRVALDARVQDSPSRVEFEQADAAWDREMADEEAAALLQSFGEARFDLLQALEAAPDNVWDSPLAIEGGPSAAPIRLDTLLLHARQHELEHLADIWRVALYWDRTSAATEPPHFAHGALPLHAADRFSQGVTPR
jgi:hypothetical protein